MTSIREDGNVIHVQFAERFDPLWRITAVTELLYQDDLAALFRVTIETDTHALLTRHILLTAGDDPAE